MPVVSVLARRSGATLACTEDAERMLAGGELVGVWPEGFKGIGKPYAQRYKLQRFGRGGFVSAALRTGVPIVPLSVVGAEEIYPLVGNVPSLARLLGVPYIPITPFFPWLGPLGLVPLPSKWLLEFGEPIRTDEYDAGAADDPMLVFNVTDQVRETIQQTLYTLLMDRAVGLPLTPATARRGQGLSRPPVVSSTVSSSSPSRPPSPVPSAVVAGQRVAVAEQGLGQVVDGVGERVAADPSPPEVLSASPPAPSTVAGAEQPGVVRRAVAATRSRRRRACWVPSLTSPWVSRARCRRG